MRALRIAIAVLAAAVLAILLLLHGSEPESAPLSAAADASAPGTGPAPREMAVLAADAGEAERAVVDAPPPAPALTADAALAADGLAEIRGRFLFASGAPARGVALRVHGWGGNQERLLKHGPPKDWTDPSGESAHDGSFALRFDPPLAFQFTLEARLAGHAAANWRWTELEPGSTTDLGDVTLAPAGSILARVVDADGRPIPSGWTVYADGAPQGSGGSERDDTRARVALESGVALLEGLPPGPATLRAHSPIANWIDGPAAQVRAGETVEAEIRYAGPDNSRRIVVVTSTRPFHMFGHDVRPITLTGAGIEPREPQKIGRSASSYGFDDLAPGNYSVQIDDPRFLPWRQDGVQPGSRVNAKLQGSASVQLAVVDDASGAAVASYVLDVRFDGVNFRPNLIRVKEAGAEPPADGVFDGLIPRDQTLVVRAEGYAPCEVAVPALTAHEMRTLVARLSRGATLGGVVRRAGTDVPVAGAEVSLRPGERKDWQGIVTGPKADPDARATRTDAAGRFEFTALGDGRWTIEACVSTLVFVERVVELPADLQRDLVLELPATAHLVGRVLGPPGASFAGLTLVAMPTREAQRTWNPHDTRWAHEDSFAAAIESDGGFRTQPVPAGAVEVWLRLPRAEIPTGRRSRMGQEGGKLLIETVALEPGENHRDFDVGRIFPGRIEVTGRVNGAPAAGLVVQASSVEAQTSFSGAVVLDAEGRGTLGPLAPGAYRLSTSSVDAGWLQHDVREFQVAPNGSVAAVLELALVEGALLVVDAATGAPRANHEVWLMSLDGHGNFQSLRTDGAGRLRLELPAGRYRVWQGAAFAGEEHGVAFDWTASGPSPAQVALGG